jgi:hypothetical protein
MFPFSSAFMRTDVTCDDPKTVQLKNVPAFSSSTTGSGQCACAEIP